MAKVLKALPPTFRFPVIALVFSGMTQMGMIWQQEIIDIWVSNGKFVFELPFFIGGSINIWWVRDLVDLITILAWVLGVWGGYQLGARDGINRFRRKVMIRRLSRAISGE